VVYLKDFIESRIIAAVQELLTGRVNGILSGFEYSIPVIEFGGWQGASSVVPVISLTACERSEKERIILLEAYSLTIAFSLPEMPESELYCYAYAGALSRAVYDDPTLGGVVDRAIVTGKKYLQPKKVNCGEGWGLIITLRLTLEGMEK